MNSRLDLYEMIFQAAQGDPTYLLGLLDYLIQDKRYSRERLARFAVRRLKIPWEQVIETFDSLGFIPPGTKLH